jgi:hypothetical protein
MTAEPRYPLCGKCQHPLASHNDNGGRNKKAYCTIWPFGTKPPTAQCGCVIPSTTNKKEHT